MTGHVTLDGNGYMLADSLASSYLRTPYNPMAVKSGGGGQYDDLQEWSAWLMEDWRAGAGQRDASAGGFKYAEADTRFKGQIILNAWPRITHRVSRSELNSRQRSSSDITVDGVTIQRMAMYCANTQTGNVDRVWVYVEGAVGTVVTVGIHANSGSDPAASALGSANVSITETIPGGHWLLADFSSVVTPGGAFWLVISATASITLTGVVTTNNAKTYNGSTWTTLTQSSDGTVWSEVYDSSEAHLRCIAVGQSNVWCAGGSTLGKIFRSSDNGVTWAETYDSPETDIFSIATDGAGVWCAGTGPNGKIYRSSDNGVTWAEIYDSSENYILSMDTDESGVWCAGTEPSGKIYRSSDNGVTWAETHDSTELQILCIDFDRSSGIWCAGTANSGKILRSSNNGVTWAEIYDSPQSKIFSIAYDNFEDGVWCAGASNGKIYRSSNNGLTWAEIYDSSQESILSLAAFNDGAIWVAGTGLGGVFLQSDDGGLTWAEVYDSTEIRISAIAAGGVLCATTDNSGKIYRSGGYTGFQVFFDTDGIAVSADAWRVVTFNSVVYALNHGTVWEWDDVDNRWESTVSIGTNSVVDAVVFGNVLYIALGINGQAKMSTSETITLQGSTYASLYLVWNGYLWRAYQNDLYYTADGTTWTGPLEVGPDDHSIRGLAGLGDSIYASTDAGLWVVSPGNLAWWDGESPAVEGIAPWGVLATTNGRGMIAHRGDLYIPVGRDLLRFTRGGGIIDIVGMGLNNVDGLPADRQGQAICLAGLNNWLVAAIAPTGSISSGKASVWAYRDGWHHILSLPVGTTIRHMSFQRDTNYLWVICKDDSFCYPVRVVLPSDTNNPAFDNSSTIRFQPYGWLETDWFYGGLREIYKDFESIFVSGEQMSNGWCKVYWQDEGSTAWEYLGQVTEDDQELRWSSGASRPNSRKIKVGLLLYGNSSNATPVVDAVRVKFQPMLTDLFRWTLLVRVEDNIQMLDGAVDSRTSSEIEDDIEAVLRSVPPVTLVDVDGTSYKVKAEGGWMKLRRLVYNGSMDYEANYQVALRQVIVG